MEKKLNILINNVQFPKLFEIDDSKLDNIILNLLNIGYQNVFSSVSEKNILNNFENICRKFKDDIICGIDDRTKQYNNKEQIDNLNGTINKLFGITKSSNKKGEVSEN